MHLTNTSLTSLKMLYCYSYDPTAVNEDNCGELHMHLTNTSLNSAWGKDESTDEDDSEEDEEDEEEDSDEEEEEDDEDDDEPADCKGLLSDVMCKLKANGVDTDALWQDITRIDITRIVRLTLNAIHPEVALNYSTCFQKADATAEMASAADGSRRGKKKSDEVKDGKVPEKSLAVFSDSLDPARCFQIVGFDIFLDKACKPFIIEINHNPSFKLPTELDIQIKTAALAHSPSFKLPTELDIQIKTAALALAG
ncbi:hypothetical protein T484DRAFT_1827647 [Baffinella frigidus]|nr:hypothetical protein T484DRAFT_1827647 [Cryptophyta sp. CCMP2293]